MALALGIRTMERKDCVISVISLQDFARHFKGGITESTRKRPSGLSRSGRRSRHSALRPRSIKHRAIENSAEWPELRPLAGAHYSHTVIYLKVSAVME